MRARSDALYGAGASAYSKEVIGLALPISEELLNALAEQVAERVRERRRWAEIEATAEYLGVSVRRVRDLHERGMPAKKIGRRLLFDLRAADAWLEAQE
jgi:excisionase family DNA binding protein